ncbi:MAG: twin-arginine translocase subunit TatB [Desulfatitalea sp.]|nr:twin-arginine translocase subunit TatB [Desulfatitalea sp.]
MFGIGMPELIVILAVALIFIGPKKLPDLAKSLGKALGEFKRATSDLKQSLEQEAGLDEVRENLKQTDRDVRKAFDASDTKTASAPKERAADDRMPSSDLTPPAIDSSGAAQHQDPQEDKDASDIKTDDEKQAGAKGDGAS